MAAVSAVLLSALLSSSSAPASSSALASSSAPASAAKTQSVGAHEYPTDVVEAASMLAPGIDVDEAVRRLYAEGDRARFIASLAAEFPDLFGWWSYDGTSDTVWVHLAGAAPDRLTQLTRESGLNVNFAPVAVDVNTLQVAAADAQRILDGALLGASAKADPQNGTVAVGTRPGQEKAARDLLESAHWIGSGVVPLSFVVWGADVPESCTGCDLPE